MKRKQSTQNVLWIVLILLAVFGLVFSGLMLLESTFGQSDAPQTGEPHSKTITRNGVEYFPRQDITVVAFMGIDEMGPVQSSQSYRNTGEADALALLILDETNKTYSILTLNRDTMLDMPVLGLGNKEAGTFYGQLALAHTYGSGLEDSAVNTVRAISDFLYGITIDHYVALNMGGIPKVNDAVGGVTVTITDDFSAVDPTLTKGTVTLRGEQALNYVRTRKEVGDQLNLSRMQRHEAYMQGLVTALTAKLEESDSFVVDAYQQVSEYVVTDCSVNVISGILARCGDYQFREIVSPQGENILGQAHYEFYADETALDALILRLFYAEK